MPLRRFVICFFRIAEKSELSGQGEKKSATKVGSFLFGACTFANGKSVFYFNRAGSL